MRYSYQFGLLGQMLCTIHLFHYKFLSVSRKAQIKIEIGIEFVISFGEIIQLACQQAVLTTL